MKPDSVRTSIYTPRNLHRKLRAEAAKRGCSMKHVVVAAIEQAIAPTPPKKGRLTLERGLVRRAGKPFSLTNEEIL
jgi:hypothetical protein